MPSLLVRTGRVLFSFTLAIIVSASAASASTPCGEGADCGPTALTSQLYGFISINTTLTYASPGPTYDVLGDVVVNPGVTLTVQPGVTLRFAANHDTLQGGDYMNRAELLIRGTLACDASAGDSIRFVSSGTGATAEWGQIKVESNGSATLRKVAISGATSAVVLFGPATLENVAISNSAVGVYAYGGPVTLSRLVLSDVGDGIYFLGTGGIHECIIHGVGTGMGLYLGNGASTAPADSTHPIPTEVAGFNYGVRGVAASNLVVHHNQYGFYVDNAMAMNYCTSVSNTFGVYSPYPASGPVLVYNSIVASGTYGIRSEWVGTPWYVDYTDTWNNSANYNGQISVGPNTASFNPFFVDPGSNDYRLAANSIFKGSSNSSGEIGAYGPGTCLVVGAQGPDGRPQSDLRASPNPAASAVEFSFDQQAPGPVSVDVVDVLGRRVQTIDDGFREAGRQHVAWDGRGRDGGKVVPGLYFWRVSSGGAVRTGRLIVAR
jgi:hypothetical protein